MDDDYEFDWGNVYEFTAEFVEEIVNDSNGRFTKWDVMDAMLTYLMEAVTEDGSAPPSHNKVSNTIGLAGRQLAKLPVPRRWRFLTSEREILDNILS
jgi:hypothetical protein